MAWIWPFRKVTRGATFLMFRQYGGISRTGTGPSGAHTSALSGSHSMCRATEKVPRRQGNAEHAVSLARIDEARRR